MDVELKKIHSVDLLMLKETIKIFEEHNLEYFLIGGTLLGAIRHKGFIPWDDDLDIGVPRASYNVFIKKYAKELPNRYRLQDYNTKSGSKYYISRIQDLNVQVKERRGADLSTEYASIDLFPIDGTPNGKIRRNFFVNKVMFWRMIASFSQSKNIDLNRKRNIFEKLLVYIARILPFDSLLDTRKIYNRIDILLSKYSMENSQVVGSLMGAYRKKELFSGEYVKRLTKVTFEDTEAYAPYEWDKYLKHMYGNYMEIPNRDEIERKRHFEIVRKNKESF
ncbi:LicD family protein [Pediococcus pentosaceus]|jgi:lipopolysaccharide cholinephosphotransferase|uniref:LicD family protein n=1 Tax=Pediococcus pentosaceus TaxID=1255 RepID=UPI000E35F8FF|nr:LicD family protein [Pediococcus pentosaceus]AXR43189.1 hypothetical protein CKK51_03250 [Pediococcus pentosaceus]MDE7511089.1 LicD family protein [Pediococcus pentosaceus]